MKIGVLSDTHIPKTVNALPEAVCDGLRKADLILHAGDLVELKVLEDLKKIAPTEAVRGNMDSWKTQNALPKKKVINVSKFKIGLIHGWGRSNIITDLISKEFTDVDVIVFGHTHNPMNEKKGNILYFNPGSPTDKIFAPYNSYGILEVNETITGRIIKLN